jgi:hypothetical protein
VWRRCNQQHAIDLRCDTRQQWKGSSSEQRLLTSLGLWEVAEQAREWEEAEEAAGARYDRIGNVFGMRGSSVTSSPVASMVSGSRRTSGLQGAESFSRPLGSIEVVSNASSERVGRHSQSTCCRMLGFVVLVYLRAAGARFKHPLRYWSSSYNVTTAKTTQQD